MTNILLWIDDERNMPVGYTHWAKTSQEAIDILSSLSQEDVLVLVSFDHDLGYNYEDGHSSLDNDVPDDNTRRVATWMVEHHVFPEMAIIHSHNPIGASWLYRTLVYDGPEGMKVIKAPFDAKFYE